MIRIGLRHRGALRGASRYNYLPGCGNFGNKGVNIARGNSTVSNLSKETPEIQHKLTSFENVDNGTEALTSDQLGYLDSIGMANGYGPTALIERLLELTHVYTGLPWWVTIVVATVGVRAVLFPLYVKASINGAKMAKAKPELDQAMNAMKEAENPLEQYKAAQGRKAVVKKYDLHMTHQLFPVIQLPIAYGFFQGLRKMANHPVEGFSGQGYAWFNDLTSVDPYCGLQMITAGLVILMVRSGGETGAAAMNPMMKKVLTFVPILSIFITKELSAAVVLYFAANSAFAIVQTLLLRSRHFRKLAKMPAILPRSNTGQKQPTTVSEWWNEMTKDMNKSTEKKMKESNSKLGAIQKRKSDINNGFIKKH